MTSTETTEHEVSSGNLDSISSLLSLYGVAPGADVEPQQPTNAPTTDPTVAKTDVKSTPTPPVAESDDDEDDVPDVKDDKGVEDQVSKAKREAKNRYIPQISKLAKERDTLKAELDELKKSANGSMTPEVIQKMIDIGISERMLSEVSDKSEAYFYKKNETLASDKEFAKYVDHFRGKYPSMPLEEIRTMYVGENPDKFAPSTASDKPMIDISSVPPEYVDVSEKKELSKAEQYQIFLKATGFQG